MNFTTFSIADSEESQVGERFPCCCTGSSIQTRGWGLVEDQVS